jgi:hypothetical protein
MALPGIGDGYQFSDGNTNEVKLIGGSILQFANGLQIQSLSVAITANTTTTTAPAGSLGITTNATGNASVFVSDGSKWQLALAKTS